MRKQQLGMSDLLMSKKIINSGYKTEVAQYSGPPESKDSGRLFNNLIEDLISVDDLARILKVPKKTIYGWIYRKKIIPIKIGPRLLRFKRSYIDQWVSQF